MRLTSQPKGANSKISTSSSFKLEIPDWARILIVCDDDLTSERLNIVLREAGFISERATSITAGCEFARFGQFQVVISAPQLNDGSWRRLVDISNYYNLGFVVFLVASPFDFNQSAEAQENGAFDVLDVLHELPKVAEATKRAMWAAYLKGAGPSPEVANSSKAA
jgi:DNA-binding NtrC family response regulator